jgi:hypothetical protein
MRRRSRGRCAHMMFVDRTRLFNELILYISAAILDSASRFRRVIS